MSLAAVLLAAVLQASAQPAFVEDPALLAAVQRFYETQEKEDIAGYLALWSDRAQRPSADQLKFIFETGDDRFSDLRITRVIASKGRARVRLEVVRERTSTPPPGGPPARVFTTRLRAALTFEREGDEWKLIREGQAADDLAAEMLEAATDAEREALLGAEPDLVGQPLLTAIARLGGAASVKQDYAGALKIYQQLATVARGAGYKKEEGEALQNVANALYFMRRFAEALTAFEQRLAIERERQDEAGIAAALSGIATVRYSFAEYGEALARYREALTIQERLDDVAGIAYSAISIGNITYLQGDFPAAIDAYRRGLELNRSMFHADGESRALEGLGRVYMAQGNYAAALEAFNAVLTDERMQAARLRLGSVAQHVGDVHFRLGNLDAAKSKYEESRAHFESAADMANVGRVTQGIALTELVASRFGGAEDLYKQSGAICTAAGDDACTAGATAGLAYAQAAQEKYWDAIGSYRKAAAEFAAQGRREEMARCEIGLSQALAGAEDFAGAVDAAGRARQIAIVIEHDDVLWRALTAEARAIRKLGDRERALGVARAAVAVVDRLQAAALDRPGASVTTEAAGALATFAVLQAEDDDATGAFATSERIRALEVRAGLATNEREISRSMTVDERAEERALATHLNTRLAQLMHEKGLPKPDAARIAGLEKAVGEAREMRRRWMRRLFERYPDLPVWRGLGPPRSAVDAAAILLGRGEVILSLVLDDDDLLALTVSRQEEDGVVLPALVVESHVMHVKRRHVSGAVLTLQQSAAQNDGVRWRQAMEELAAILPPAVHTHLRSASKLFVLPHDVWWRVPFEALPIGHRLLGDGATVSLAGSLESLVRGAKHSTRAPTPRVLAIGPPELTPERLTRYKHVAPGWTLRSPDVAQPELEAIAGVYERDLLTLMTGSAATEAALRAQRGTSLLHIAAPFRINAASPLFSPILLTTTLASNTAASGSADAPAPSRDSPEDDGVVDLREVMNMEFGARVVVFSDGSATSMRDGAAAADVVQWGWLAAGVPTLLVARWAPPPGAGARLLSDFHRQLRQGMEPAAALRAAQLLIRSNPETAPPIHWAGWMLLGAR